MISFRIAGPPSNGDGQGFSKTMEQSEMFFWFNYTKQTRFFEIRKNGDLVKRVDLVEQICSEQESCSQYCNFHDSLSSACSVDQQQVQQKQDQDWVGILMLATAVLFTLTLILYRRRS